MRTGSVAALLAALAGCSPGPTLEPVNFVASPRVILTPDDPWHSELVKPSRGVVVFDGTLCRHDGYGGYTCF